MTTSPTDRILVVLLSDRNSKEESSERSTIDKLSKWINDVAVGIHDLAAHIGDVSIDIGVSLCLPKHTTTPRNDLIQHAYYYRESSSGMSTLLDYASRHALAQAAARIVGNGRASQIFQRFEYIADARICMERNADPDKENTPNPITTTTVGSFPSMDEFPLEEHLDVDEFFYFDSEYAINTNYRNTLVRVHLNNNDLYGLLYYREPHVHTYKKRVSWREFLKLPGTFLDEDQMFSMFSRWLFLHQLTQEHGETYIEDTYSRVIFVTESMMDCGISPEVTQEVVDYLNAAKAHEEPMVITSFDSTADSDLDTNIDADTDSAVDSLHQQRDLWIPTQFDPATAVASCTTTDMLTPRSHSLVVTSRTFATPYLRFFEECLVLHGNLYFMKMHTETIETEKQWDLNDVMELYLSELDAGRNERAM